MAHRPYGPNEAAKAPVWGCKTRRFAIQNGPNRNPLTARWLRCRAKIMKRFDKNGNTAAVCLTARQRGHPRLKTDSGHGTAGMATIAGHRQPRPCCTPEPTKIW